MSKGKTLVTPSPAREFLGHPFAEKSSRTRYGVQQEETLNVKAG